MSQNTERPSVVIAYKISLYASALAEALTRLWPGLVVEHLPAAELDGALTDGHAGAIVVTG